MTSPATYFIDDTATTARALEVVDASFDNGMNLGGSSMPGVGINMLEGAIVGTAEQFTLLDQTASARTPQASQHIGGSGLGNGSAGTLPDAPVRFGAAPTQAAKDADSALDGTIINTGDSTLTTLGAGWVSDV